MLDLAGGTTVYLACGATDLRKSYNGLAAVIKLKFQLDPYSRCMFAFCNRRRTLIKILQWDGSGFWILMKRLDRDAFHWPDTPDELRQVTMKEMHWPGGNSSVLPVKSMPKVMNRWICSMRQKHRQIRRQRNRLLRKSILHRISGRSGPEKRKRIFPASKLRRRLNTN